MKAILKNYRQSPRKVRLVADLIKGKSAFDADVALRFLPKRAALPIQKLLASAIANARANSGIEKDGLIVKDVRVDKGMVLKRSMPRARGSASRINKRSSHLTIILSEKNGENSKSHTPHSKEIEPKKTEKAPQAEKPAKKKVIKPKAKKVNEAKG